nr:tetratricopeptide repeat protein [Bacteroidota bacterium]
MLKSVAYFVVLMMIFFAFESCSRKKNSFTRRVYHNLTAHYNAYWNGNESFKEGVAELEKNVKDNYTLILPVYKYGTEQDAQSIFPNMDRAMEKASKVIQSHSMYFKRKEYVRWIDDSYMLIGKAYFYKKEFSSARRTFEFITNRFAKDDSRYEAELWLARTYNQTEEFEKAVSMLDNLNSSLRSEKAPASLEKNFTKVYANYFILQQDYEPAIKYLQRAIEINTKKKDKNRLRFILAQIYQELGDLQEAAKLYQLVIKKNPTYEMSFNAKINLAKTYDAKASNRSMIVKKLNKMLKDSKNEEYRDQIYFALAEIYLKDKDVKKAIEYLTLSVSTSVSNDYQKSLSALKLAEIHFDKQTYSLAQAYFDTTMQFLPLEYPNYDELKDKTETLTELITNLTIVQDQDSLQNLARMPEEERNKVIDAFIKKIAEEEARLQAEEVERQRTLSMLEQTNRQQNRAIQQSGGWYFYNPSSVSFGYTEFQKKWGRRKLEDLWRLSSKQIVADFGDEEEDLAASDSLATDSTLVVETDPKKRDFYLQDLPMTEEKLVESNALIEEAIYIMGFIYKDGLKDNEKSIETLELLIERFPATEHGLQVYYQLYKNWEEVPDDERALYYRNMIVRDFPDSDYARIIIDPNYNLVLQAQRNAAKNFYEDTYSAYLNNQFYMVVNNYNEAVEKYPESNLLSKFEMLKALSVGQIQNLDSLAVSLEYLIATYPDSEVKPLAEDILSRLRRDESGNLVISEQPTGGDEIAGKVVGEEENIITPYLINLNTVHFFLFIVDGSKTNINALKIRLSDFNSKYYRTLSLKINSIIFKNELQMITVGNFENAENVMDYLRAVTENPYILAQLEGTSYESMVISVDNYPILYREKDLEVYKSFFKSTYGVE